MSAQGSGYGRKPVFRPSRVCHEPTLVVAVSHYGHNRDRERFGASPEARGGRRLDGSGRIGPQVRRCCLLTVAALVLQMLVAGVAALTVLSPAEAAPSGGGTVRYVSPSGSDHHRGTRTKPFRTLRHGLERLRAGDTLLVRGGRYTENITNVSLRTGTRAARITVRNYPGERPVLRGLLWLENPSYWVVSGLDVTWNRHNDADQHMVRVTGGTRWRLTRGEFWGARSYAALLIAGKPSRYRIDHMYLHNTYRSNGNNQDHLLYISARSRGGVGVVERSIFAHSRNGRGIKIGPPSEGRDRVGNVQIRYNTFYDNTGPSSVQLSYRASGISIHHNLFLRSGSDAVTAYRLKGTRDVVHHNLAWRCKGVVERGIRNVGHNRMRRFSLAPSYRPQGRVAAAYGRYAS